MRRIWQFIYAYLLHESTSWLWQLSKDIMHVISLTSCFETTGRMWRFQSCWQRGIIWRSYLVYNFVFSMFDKTVVSVRAASAINAVALSNKKLSRPSMLIAYGPVTHLTNIITFGSNRSFELVKSSSFFFQIEWLQRNRQRKCYGVKRQSSVDHGEHNVVHNGGVHRADCHVRHTPDQKQDQRSIPSIIHNERHGGNLMSYVAHGLKEWFSQ